MQYPDNFNFDITRAINAPEDFYKTKATATTDEGGSSREESAAETEVIDTVSESEVLIGITRADELDPVALNKDFKFAVWASVALVRFIHT